MSTTWQLSDIRTEVRERMGLSTNDTAVTNAILTDIVNAAQRKLSLVHDWPWLIEEDLDFTAFTIGQRKYAVTVPHDEWRKTLYIVVDGDTVMTVKQPQDIHRFSADTTGMPRFYAISGTDIYVWPTPDQAYSVLHVYVKDPAVLSADGDTPAIEDWAIDLLVAQACVLTALRLRDFEMASMFRVEYAQILQTMQDEVRRTRQLPAPRHRNDVSWP